jgi:hypothetical protein
MKDIPPPSHPEPKPEPEPKPKPELEQKDKRADLVMSQPIARPQQQHEQLAKAAPQSGAAPGREAMTDLLSKPVPVAVNANADAATDPLRLNKFRLLAMCLDIVEAMGEHAMESSEEAKAKKELEAKTDSEARSKAAETATFHQIEAKESKANANANADKEEGMGHRRWEGPKSESALLQEKMNGIFEASKAMSLALDNSRDKVWLPIDLAVYLSVWQEVRKQSAIANKCLLHVFKRQLNLAKHLEQLRK